MPCKSSEIAFDEFCNVLTQIADIVDSCEGANTILEVTLMLISAETLII